MYNESSHAVLLTNLLPGLHYNFLVSSDLICCLVFAVNQCGGGSGGDDALWASGTLRSSHHIIVPTSCPQMDHMVTGPIPLCSTTSFMNTENQFSSLTCFPQPQEMQILEINYIWVPDFCSLRDMTAQCTSIRTLTSASCYFTSNLSSLHSLAYDGVFTGWTHAWECPVGRIMGRGGGITVFNCDVWVS